MLIAYDKETLNTGISMLRGTVFVATSVYSMTKQRIR
jgi:hypothetical protein